MSTITIAHVTRIAHDLYAVTVTPEHIAPYADDALAGNLRPLAQKGQVNLHDGKNLASIVNRVAKVAGFVGAVKPKTDGVWATLLADCETRNRKAGAEKAKATTKPAPKGKGKGKAEPVSESVKANRAIAEAASGLPPMVEGIKVAMLQERVGKLEQGVEQILNLLTSMLTPKA